MSSTDLTAAVTIHVWVSKFRIFALADARAGLGIQAERGIEHDGRLLSVGEATSVLMQALAQNASVDYVSYLEDNWEAACCEANWLQRGCKILESNPQIGQVRVRRDDERVLPHHMITGVAIDWRLGPGYRLAESAHFTFNPNLIRASDLGRIYPCTGEKHAQQRFLEARLATAQLLPGVFRHIGSGRSLREQNAAEARNRGRSSRRRSRCR